MRHSILASIVLAVSTTFAATPDPSQLPPPKSPAGEVGPGVPAFRVRPGYRVTLAAKGIGQCRFLLLAPDGTLYVSQPGSSSITALRDPDENGLYQHSIKFIADPHTYGRVEAMDIHNGELWFSTPGNVFHTKALDGHLAKAGDVTTVFEEGELPTGGGHWYRSLLVDDDGFYTSLGDDQNIGDETKNDREKIWHYSLDGKEKKLFASGIRNTEKLRYRPLSDGKMTKEIWGTDNGSDNFGGKLGEGKDNQPITDTFPPEEFNHYVQDGFYGHPFLIGPRVPRIEYQDRPDILQLAAKTIIPEYSSPAHWAGLGWTFVTSNKLTGHIGDAIIAYHGSWNSTIKVGYRVQLLPFDEWTGHPIGGEPLVTCLNDDSTQPLARPVDLAESPDGTVLFSSDSPGNVYRITRINNQTTPAASASTP
jgi:glucose/arabinose dehydrogenase